MSSSTETIAKREARLRVAPRLLAYTVTDKSEGTGGIIFAASSAAARRLGAQQFSDGDFSSMDCRRASYADGFAVTGRVPAYVLVEQGWHFECSNCGNRIDYDHLADKDILPEDVRGDQDCAVYCNRVCEAESELERAQAQRMEKRWLRRFRKIIKTRFPEATFPTSGYHKEHAYASRHKGKWRLEQIRVPFHLPCTTHGPAMLSIEDRRPRMNETLNRKTFRPQWTCCEGDVAEFKLYISRNPASAARKGHP